MLEPLNVENFINLLQKCRQKKNLVEAKHLHAYMRDQNVESHPVLGNYLVSMLVDCGDFSAAGQVFDRLPYRSQYSWSSLIAGYVDCGDLQHAIHLYQKMQDEGVQTKNFTFRSLLKGCSEVKDFESGRKVHAAIVEGGLEKDAFIGSAIVDMYGKCRLLADACGVFDRLADQDEVLWTVLIAGYAEQGFVEEVWTCLERMQWAGVSLDASTFVCSLKVCVVIRDPKEGQKLHAEIVLRGIEQELYVGHTLVDMYAKCGLLLEARELLDRLPVRSVVPWTALIAGYAENGLGEEALICLEQMQQEGTCPVGVTFLSSLKACAIIGALHAGQEIHLEILKRGLEIDAYVGSALVDMYAKCGSLSESRKVLSRLPAQSAVAWNALIAGYTDYGFGEEAINCLEQFRQEGVCPVANTFVHCLKACSVRGALETGRELHGEIIKQGWEGHYDVSNTLVDFYAKCGSVTEASVLFDLQPAHSIVSWTALILGYAEIGLGDEVFNCFEQMQREAVYLDKVVFVCSLKACSMLEAFETGQSLHSHVVKRGWEREANIGTTLLNMYAECGLLAEAQEVFDRLQVQGLELWNILIAGYLENGFEKKALSCLHIMQLKDLSPMTTTFSCILKACGSLRASEAGRELHVELTKKGLELEVEVGNALVDMYAKCGFLVEGCKCHDMLTVKNVFSWTSIIAGYTEHGLGDEAMNGIKMMLESICPSASTLIFSLKACGMVGALGIGQTLHIGVIRKGLEKDTYVGTALVDMYAKCGSFAEAKQVLFRLTIRGVVTWNALISGFADHGFGEEALICFTEMQLQGVYPVGVTYACTLKSCGLVEALETGWEIHGAVTRRGLERDPFIGSALIDMYTKCGKLAEAQKVFDTLPAQDVATWNAMIKGNGENHEGLLAVKCFENMKAQGVKPNGITYICLLAACSYSNLVVKGKEYFKMMVEQGIKPTLDHYTCMVDLLARSGRIHEAAKFAETSHCLQTEEILRALLSACKIHGEVVLGQKFFEQLIHLNQEDAAAYLLMAEIYTNAGRWSDARRIEEERIHAAARKMPAKASIQVNKKLCDFVVGDEQSEGIGEILEVLNLRMRRAGYMPILDVASRHVPEQIRERTSCDRVGRKGLLGHGCL